MPRFLHAADIHLDSPLQKLAAYDLAPVDQIRHASRRALASMVDLAVREKVDAVLIAGDLYDGNWNDQNTGLHFVAQAAKLVDHGIAVLVIRGNHDAENVMTSSLPLPSNPDGSSIMVAADRVETRVLESAGIAVHGRSFASRSVTENLAIDYPSPVSGMANVGMLHTSLSGAEGHDTYSPCTADYLTGKQYDYWALGHVHTRHDHAVGDGRVPVVFPGNLQGRHIRECGPRGCMIVDVDSSHRCTPTFHPLDEVRWQRIVIDASTIEHPDEVMDHYRREIEDSLAGAPPLLVTRVEVRGETGHAAALHRSSRSMLADLRAAAVAMADGRIWMEDYKLRVVTPEVAVVSPESASGQDSAPRRSIAAAAEELIDAPEASEWLAEDLKPLLKKMPVELMDAPEVGGDDSVLAIDDVDWTRRLITQAAAELEARLDVF